MTRFLQHTLSLMTGVIAVGTSSVALAQGNTFNPYGNSGYADYREFTTATYSSDPSLPGQARLQSGFYGGVGRSNQFESYVNSIDRGAEGDSFNTSRGTASGVPYYRANQIYSKQDRRSYRPNDTPEDREFQARMAKRETDYAKALEEKDPRKRAALIRKIDQNSVAVSTTTPKTASTNKTAKSATTPKSATAKAGSAAPTAPSARRTPAAAPPASAPAPTPTATTPAPKPATTPTTPIPPPQ